MYREISVILIIVMFPGIALSGTFFEQHKDTQDPYIAQKGGVGSIFVNPAGTAGHSGFDLKFRSEMQTTTRSRIFFDNLLSVLDSGSKLGQKIDKGEEIKAEDIKASVLALQSLFEKDAVTEESLKSIFRGTIIDPSNIDWSSRQEVIDNVKNMKEEDYVKFSGNFLSVIKGENEEFFESLGRKKLLKMLADIKMGFLIKGFGLGTYMQIQTGIQVLPSGNAYPNGFLGVDSVYGETGIILGGGFNLFEGRLSLGFTGNYGALIGNSKPINLTKIANIIGGDTTMTYGNTWGIDAGVIWRPLPDLSLGLVLNDIIGTTEKLGDKEIDGLSDFLKSKLFSLEGVEYKFTTDIDIGVTWHPSWQYVSTSFSLDLYDFIGYIRSAADEGDNFGALMKRSLSHLRLGANARLFDFLKVGFQYYREYISLGAGFDMLFMELYGEYKVHNDFIFANGNSIDNPFGASVSLRISF